MSGIGLSLNIVKPTVLNIVTSESIDSSDSADITESGSSTPSKSTPSSDRVNAEDYQRYDSTREHIYNITDTYIGSDEQMDREERVLDLNTMKFLLETIKLPEGVERLFVEISSNSGDNVARSLRNGVDPGEVTIVMDRKTISVRNGGIPIPIEIHSEYMIWVIELIFGKLHSSSNYNKKKKDKKVRTECGRNGYGAKLTNIFSKKFMVTVGDHHNKKWYRQIWQENMTIVSEPDIKDYDGPSFVEVVYEMDFERFGYKEYPDEAFRLYARHAADMSFTGKVPVSFNGVKLNVENGIKYAKLYLEDDTMQNSIIYYKWPKGTKTYVENGVVLSKQKGVVPEIEICAVDTPDKALSVSFVNGMWTKNGGVHADAAFKSIASSIVTTINGQEKKERKYKIDMGDVKKHVSLFVSCWLPDPKFDGQTKTTLRSPAPKIVIDKKIIEPIMNWNLIHRLYAELDAKHFKILSKSDGKKKKHIEVKKGKDANFAGSSKSKECTLIVVEGNSAGGYADTLMCLSDNGRDKMGILPLRGKPLNVMNAPALQIGKNVEIKELKRMLGLREKVNYLVDENFKTLRYGHLMILSDSDVDGKHITGLILNIFHCLYPSLLARGFVKYLRTKIIDVKKGKKYLKFYTYNEYCKWRDVTPDYEKWEHNYYKGLGTSEDSDIEEDFKDPRIVACIYDDLAPLAITKAFDKELAHQRKDWISEWIPDYSVEDMKMQPISGFINHEMIQFSIEDITRSLPGIDGLKRTQRKIIWGCMKKWGAKVGSDKATKIKVSNLGSYISDATNYHHGEKSINDTIIKMVQGFVGANNLPYLCAHGQFGTRDKKGKDAAAPRYPLTKPEWWWNYIFKKEDMPILEMEYDEGIETEPKVFLPIIPMILVNGSQGIGTAHSTYIPNHNPMDICNWFINKIKGKPLDCVIPWYKAFTGNIEIKVKKSKKVKKSSDTAISTTKESPVSFSELNNTEDILEPDEIAIDKNTKYTMVTTGIFEEVGKKRKKVIITELPIGRGTYDYEQWLGKLIKEKVITSYTAQSIDNGVYFEIFGMKNPTYRKLRLHRSFGMSNMVILDSNNRPIKYNSALEILEGFYSFRLPRYEIRRKNIISEIESRVSYLNLKIRFIKSVIGGHELSKNNPNITIDDVVQKGCILVMNRRKSDILPQMTSLEFPEDLLKKVTLYNCTKEEIEASLLELSKLEDEKISKEKVTAKDLWLSDLEDFVKAYCKKYKVKNDRKDNIKKVTLNITQE